MNKYKSVSYYFANNLSKIRKNKKSKSADQNCIHRKSFSESLKYIQRERATCTTVQLLQEHNTPRDTKSTK